MAKRKRFRCPCCGLLVWTDRLANSSYPLELVDVESEGRGLIKNIFFDWDTQNPLHALFEKHFFDVLEYLLMHDFIDASAVKKLAEVFMKAPDAFRQDLVFDLDDLVFEPDLVFNPKNVE